MDELKEVTLSFTAMNTDVEVIACVFSSQSIDAERTLRKVRKAFQKVEKTLSRFIPDSELCKLNASAGKSFKASRLLFEVVKMSLEANVETKGIFDPTILPDLISAGYDRSFEGLEQRQKVNPASAVSRETSASRRILLDSASFSIYLPAGVKLDLGGIGKGWAVDYVSRYLRFFPGYAIDAGGDIRVGGQQTDGCPWNIAVEDPFLKGHDLALLQLSEGAVCTSTITKRRWQLANTWKHHLIDPHTGQPARSGVAAVTVMAETAARAEIIAKVSLILGPVAGLEFMQGQPNVKGLLVLADGHLTDVKSSREAVNAV